MNQANAAGVVPTETLIEVTQSDDGKSFTVKGVSLLLLFHPVIIKEMFEDKRRYKKAKKMS